MLCGPHKTARNITRGLVLLDRAGLCWASNSVFSKLSLIRTVSGRCCHPHCVSNKINLRKMIFPRITQFTSSTILISTQMFPPTQCHWSLVPFCPPPCKEKENSSRSCMSAGGTGNRFSLWPKIQKTSRMHGVPKRVNNREIWLLTSLDGQKLW